MILGVGAFLTLTFFLPPGKGTHFIVLTTLGVAFYFKFGVIAPKRLHDVNDSGWLALILLIPVFGFAYDIVLLFKKG